MNNSTGFSDGPSEVELLRADINLWKEDRDNLYINPPEEIVQSIVKSEIAAAKLLSRVMLIL